MNRKIKIAIGIIAVIILIFIIINIFKDNSNEIDSTETETQVSDVKYDEDTGEYYILDEETGEILHTGASEEELYIYTIDPDYDPKMPAEDTVSNETVEYNNLK